MEVYENFSGARMHAALHKPLSIKNKNGFFFFKKTIQNIKNLPISLSEINSILFFNKV
jgi:hypothetical protein